MLRGVSAAPCAASAPRGPGTAGSPSSGGPALPAPQLRRATWKSAVRGPPGPPSGQLPKSRGRSDSLPNAPAPQLPLAHVPTSPRLPPGAARVRHARERRCLRVAASHPRAGFPDCEGLRLPPRRAASPPSWGPAGVSVMRKFSKSRRPAAGSLSGRKPAACEARRFLPAVWSWKRSHRVELASKGTLRLARLLSRLPPLYV